MQVRKRLHVRCDDLVHVLQATANFVEAVLPVIQLLILSRDVRDAFVEELIEVEVVFGEESHRSARKGKYFVLRVVEYERVDEKVERKDFVAFRTLALLLQPADAQLHRHESFDVRFGLGVAALKLH